MDFVVIGGTGLCMLMVGLGIHLYRQAHEAGRYAKMMQEWIDELSTEQYRPILYLWEDTRRYRTFAVYLRNLSDDFLRGHRILWFAVWRGGVARRGMTGRLIRARLEFAACVAMLRCGVWLYRAGFGRVNARPVLEHFETMREELRALGPVRHVLIAPPAESLLSA